MRFSTGEFYHICQRGTEGRIIFPDDSYYERFLFGLLAFNSKKPIELRLLDPSDVGCPDNDERLVDVLGYILRKNHLHLLIQCIEPEGATSFFRKNFGGFTNYFNTRNQRKGVLFQGKSVVRHIDSDRYLTHVINYIHLNALDDDFPEWRTGGTKNVSEARKILLNYPWSSLPCLLGKKDDPILSPNILKELIDTDSLLESMLSWGSEEYEQGQEFLVEP